MLTVLLAVVTCSSLAQGVIIYKSNGTQEKLPYTAVDSIIMYQADKTPVPIDEIKAIDLGLPSGTLWASHNVGSTAPETVGGYYAFGETKEKPLYKWGTYMCISQADCGKSGDPLFDDELIEVETMYGVKMGVTCNIAGTKYDVATQTWGDSWVMPTEDQFHELIENCTRARVYINEMPCQEFTGPNGNSVIFPLNSGRKENDEIADQTVLEKSHYWTSEMYKYSEAQANCVRIYYDHDASEVYDYRYYGMQVRPVKKP